jgi:hypothetical protein
MTWSAVLWRKDPDRASVGVLNTMDGLFFEGAHGLHASWREITHQLFGALAEID